MNWMKSLPQFPVFFWASGLSLGIHGLTLLIPTSSNPRPPQTPPLETISLIPLPKEPKDPTSPTQTLPTPIASPPPSPTNLQASPSPKIPKIESSPDPSVVKPIDQNPPQPSPTQPESIPPKTPKTAEPIPKIPETESPEQFATRTQTAFKQATGQIERQYGDRLSQRSDTIAVSPELFFTQPDLFYDKEGAPRSGLDQAFQVEKDKPEQAFKVFEANLQNAGFIVSPVENYGGGLLYEVKSKKEGNPERVAFYLNLLLIPDKSGTIVVIWKTRPQK